MDTKIFGGVLLIVGTSIGAGMLALPITTAGSGFISSTLLLIVCWALMTFSAFLLLEVTLWFPPRTNMISMARATLGKTGELVAWVSYILLLYALLAAYISSGSAIFDTLANVLHLRFSPAINAILFVLVFGYIVYRGIKPVDYVNRYLMAIKLGSLLMIILFAVPYINSSNLLGGNPALLTSTVTVMLTSFGFAPLIPSLRSYFESDVRKLRIAILIGSLIPLLCYLFWDLVILGSLPREGNKGLNHIMQTGGSVAELVQSLSYFLKNTSITGIAHVFTVICVLTSFLSVSLGLSDFLADGIKIEKKGKKGNGIVFTLTFLPSLLIVLFYPSIFVKALSYAGIFVVILVILLPALMVWNGRYHTPRGEGHYQVAGGKTSVLFLILAACMMTALGVLQLV
ncbi:MAG: tyrP [Gammaproteobacteria bacterium]|jgi:tyrosine-specific transport protein|nr:tyrP [Gammaproteobacteria bacterium]